MNLKNFSFALGLSAIGIALNSGSALALNWEFSYSGPDVNASGMLTTTDTTNSSGYYTITGISGTRNELTISEIIDVGGFSLSNNDNLIKISSPQLTDLGFAYTLADGTEVHTYNFGFREELVNGGLYSDGLITFSATPASAAVPWDFSPTQGVALGLPLFIGLRMLKKRRALKKSQSEVHEMIAQR